VQKGDVITVDKIEATDGKTKVTVDTVLAVYDADGNNVTLGTPYIAKASVVADIE
jgi:ribosomal protein L21